MNAPYYDFWVYWSAADAVYVAEVPDLPGCSAHGATPAEAVAQATEAMRIWLAAATAAGVPFPTPHGRAKTPA